MFFLLLLIISTPKTLTCRGKQCTLTLYSTQTLTQYHMSLQKRLEEAVSGPSARQTNTIDMFVNRDEWCKTKQKKTDKEQKGLERH